MLPKQRKRVKINFIWSMVSVTVCFVERKLLWCLKTHRNNGIDSLESDVTVEEKATSRLMAKVFQGIHAINGESQSGKAVAKAGKVKY